jgi:hypothetical protein
MQGLNCNGFKRNWAKIKEKGLNRKVFPKAGGYICKYQKTQGLFCKNTRAGGVDLVASSLTQSRSDGCDGYELSGGGGIQSGALDLDPAARNARERDGQRRATESDGLGQRPAVSGGGTRQRTWTRAPGHDLKRG